MENMDKSHSTKMGAHKSAENTGRCPQNFRPNFSSQAQKFGIYKKKSLWVSVVRGKVLTLLYNYNASVVTTLNCFEEARLDSEWIYEVIVSPEIPTKK